MRFFSLKECIFRANIDNELVSKSGSIYGFML